MRKIVFIFLLLSFFNSWSQITEQEKSDSLKVKSIETFREIFWNNLPKPVNWTNDYEDLFTDEEQNILNKLISDFEKETSVEIAIVTIDTLKVSDEKFEDLSFHIANTWQVGKAVKDNGILIAISKGHKRIRIQNGNGIKNIISDEKTKMIIDNYFIPFYKNEYYFFGTFNGLKTLMSLIKSKN